MKKILFLSSFIIFYGCISLNDNASDVLVVSQNYDYEQNSCHNLGLVSSTFWKWGTSRNQYDRARNWTAELGGNTFQLVSINELTSQITGIALLCPR